MIDAQTHLSIVTQSAHVFILQVDGTRNFGRSPPALPCLQMQAVSSLRELRPLFESLHTGQQFNSTAGISNSDYTVSGAGSRLAVVEKVIFEDFLEQI